MNKIIYLPQNSSTDQLIEAVYNSLDARHMKNLWQTMSEGKENFTAIKKEAERLGFRFIPTAPRFDKES